MMLTLPLGANQPPAEVQAEQIPAGHAPAVEADYFQTQPPIPLRLNEHPIRVFFLTAAHSFDLDSSYLGRSLVNPGL